MESEGISLLANFLSKNRCGFSTASKAGDSSTFTYNTKAAPFFNPTAFTSLFSSPAVFFFLLLPACRLRCVWKRQRHTEAGERKLVSQPKTNPTGSRYNDVGSRREKRETSYYLTNYRFRCLADTSERFFLRSRLHIWKKNPGNKLKQRKNALLKFK